MQNLADLTHGRNKTLAMRNRCRSRFAPACCDGKPAASERQKLVDIQKGLERCLRVRHASCGLILFNCRTGSALTGQPRAFKVLTSVFVNRLGQVILRALALTPDLVGFLILVVTIITGIWLVRRLWSAGGSPENR